MDNKVLEKNKKLTFCERKLLEAKDIRSRKSSIFYLAICLLSVITIIVAWIIETNTNGVESTSSFFQVVDWRYIYAILSILLLVLLLRSFSDYLYLYLKTKQRKFLTLFNGNVKRNFYDNLSSYGRTGATVLNSYLFDKNIDSRLSVELSYGKRLFNRISLIIYSIVVLTIGCCFVFDGSLIWIFVASLIGFVVNCVIVIFVLYFDKSKEKYVKVVGWLSKCLYKLKLIKDYEVFYSNTIDKLVVCNTYLKAKKVVLIVQIVAELVVRFLKHLLLFVVLCMINHGSLLAFVQILFGLTMIDLVFEIYPQSKGVLIFEVLFITLFSPVFFEGYVVWGMLIYRVVDLYIPVLMFVILELIEVVFNKLKLKRLNK